MTNTQQGIITLLKSAITGESFPLPQGFDLEAAYPALKKHHMAALLYEGAVRCGIPKDLSVMQQLFQSYCRCLLVSEGQLREVQRIFDAFDRKGIDYLPLKGCCMKPRYPKPELRTMGDADILIRLEQREEIDAILEGLGFRFLEETDHELVWQSKKLYLELHKHLIPSYNKDLYPHFGTGWQLARHVSHGLHAMEAEDELVFLFTHFAKHFRDGGIGCRYVVDLWVFLRTFPELDGKKVEEKLEKLQLLEFYSNIRDLIACWFTGGPETDKLTMITDFIFASGSWGGMESKVLSVAARETKAGSSAVGGRMAYLWRSVFPPAQMLMDKYTVLKKAPWLYPLVCLYRLVYKLIFDRRKVMLLTGNVTTIHREELRTRRQLLRSVGLDYRC